jgi:hypothetical protein
MGLVQLRSSAAAAARSGVDRQMDGMFARKATDQDEMAGAEPLPFGHAGAGADLSGLPEGDAFDSDAELVADPLPMD